jgi:hypothetical protein
MLTRLVTAMIIGRRDLSTACEAQDGGLCASCAAGLARARAYLALGRDLGMDVPA